MFLVMMYETWAHRIHKFSDGVPEKFGGLFVASYLSSFFPSFLIIFAAMSAFKF